MYPIWILPLWRPAEFLYVVSVLVSTMHATCLAHKTYYVGKLSRTVLISPVHCSVSLKFLDPRGKTFRLI